MYSCTQATGAKCQECAEIGLNLAKIVFAVVFVGVLFSTRWRITTTLTDGEGRRRKE
jgi:hypothetical protein